MCVYCFDLMIYFDLNLIRSIFLALRESPIKRRSRLSKMVTGSEGEKEIISTPLGIRNDRIGLHTSPIERRSFQISPQHSDTRY